MTLTESLSQKQISYKDSLLLIWKLSLPAILSQLAHIFMQYADSAMVARISSEANASIGVVATTTWLFYGFTSAVATGFSVQIAQAFGARNLSKARMVLRTGLFSVIVFGIAAGGIGAAISFKIPSWMHAEKILHHDASIYFLIFALSYPLVMMNHFFTCCLECSGRMKTAGIIGASSCIVEVFFNAVFIYGMKLGVAGAALGTVAAEILVCIAQLVIVFCFIKEFKNPGYQVPCSHSLQGDEGSSSEKACLREGLFLKKHLDLNGIQSILKTAFKISLPMMFEQFAICGAQIMTTRIASPLGTVALAANSFGITAEALCYMPAYGISHAATTLVGQSAGAERSDLSKKFAHRCVGFGFVFVCLLSVLMYFSCPWIFSVLTPDTTVQKICIKIFRIEMLAEPFFAFSIIASGALRGIGDTLVPAVMNLVCIWGVRVSLSWVLASKYGIVGMWVAMAMELFIRGVMFMVRLFLSDFSRKKL